MTMFLKTSDFSYNAATRTFAAEISELPVQKLHDRIMLRSAKTGVDKEFLALMEKRQENETVAWYYRNDASGLVIVIFND